VKWRLLVAFLSLGFSLPANSADTTEPVSLDGICGKLIFIEQIPEKGTANSFRQQVKPFAHARIRLFPPTANADCCALVTPVAEVTTGRDGSFQFKKPEPGDYWVAATIGNKEYKVLVRFVPGKKRSTQCSTFLYVFEKGQLQFRRADALTAN
jgi:hypothetical protein